jgi:MarR family transcriptional regulator, temperature-dependent positive regulator of motility
MKKFIVFTLALALIFPIFATNADAAYIKDRDIVISIQTDKSINQYLSEDTAELSFAVQQQLIKLLNDEADIEFDYYYIWIEINGVRVLAIDPPVALF